MTLQLDLPTDADEDTVRKALQSGKAERRKVGRRAPGEKIPPSDVFAAQCRTLQLPVFAREAQFALKIGRKWAFDFCWHEYKIAVEIEGLVVQMIGGRLMLGGRHATIGGFIEDCEKYACATMLGWSVVRFAQKQVDSRYAIDMTSRILEARGWKRPRSQVPF